MRHLDQDLHCIMKSADPQFEWVRTPFVLEATRPDVTSIMILLHFIRMVKV